MVKLHSNMDVVWVYLLIHKEGISICVIWDVAYLMHFSVLFIVQDAVLCSRKRENL